MSEVSFNSEFLSNVRLRSRLLFAIESFFQARDYISLHTPTISPSLIPERHIEVFEVSSRRERAAGDSKHTKNYLLPSPELYLKQFLCHTYAQCGESPNVYELSHSFRDEDIKDSLHSHEFLMLECYSAGFSLEDSRTLCCELLLDLVKILPESQSERWVEEFADTRVLSLYEAFEEYAGISLTDLVECEDAEDALAYARVQDIREVSQNYDWEDVFHYLFLERVEPHLKKFEYLFLTDYPARLECLARPSERDKNISQRWELYMQGVEIANCFVEAQSPEQIMSFYKSQLEKIETNQNARARGFSFEGTFLHQGAMPHYSGIAMGVDRLLLVLMGALARGKGLQDISTLAYFDLLNT